MSNRALKRVQAQKAKTPQLNEDEEDFEDQAPPKKTFANAFDMVIPFLYLITCRSSLMRKMRNNQLKIG